MSVTREERVAEIQRLQAKGLTQRQIAERMGLTHASIRNYVYDPDGSKARERKKRYAGQCVDCGHPTDGSNGRDKAPTRCKWCTQGIQRPVAAHERLRVPVRLDEIPADVRLQALETATRTYPADGVELLLAAIHPSDQTYWVSESARPLLEQWGIAA